ncbi:hypothetical protein CTI14_71815, partial [Methylobacterium radiotolerans]
TSGHRRRQGGIARLSATSGLFDTAREALDLKDADARPHPATDDVRAASPASRRRRACSTPPARRST